MEQSSAAVSCEWLRVSDSSLRFFQNMFIVYSWYWGSFVWLLLLCCMMSLLWWLENVWCCVFYDLAAISTACIDSMIQSITWNEASCVVSPVLLMYGSITSVVMTYIQAFLQRFALWFSMVDEKYGYTVVGQILYSTQLTQWLNTSLGELRVLTCIKTSL